MKKTVSSCITSLLFISSVLNQESSSNPGLLLIPAYLTPESTHVYFLNRNSYLMALDLYTSALFSKSKKRNNGQKHLPIMN